MEVIAGRLLANDRREMGAKRSLVLLVTRILVTCLFIFVGYGQVDLQMIIKLPLHDWKCTKIFMMPQLSRVIARDWAFVNQRAMGKPDGHDNNWLILQCVLSIPFAVGYRCVVLLLSHASSLSHNMLTLQERARVAAACSRPYFGSVHVLVPAHAVAFMVTSLYHCHLRQDLYHMWTVLLACRQYEIHRRQHFVTNLSVAGGLLLFQSVGAGRYSVDEIMKKRTE